MNFRIIPMDSQTWRIEESDRSVSTSMYLLCGGEKAILIDTGLGLIDTRAAVEELTALPVAVLCTHGHYDHIGGNSLFDTVYLHPADKEVYLLNSSPDMGKLLGYTLRQRKDNLRWLEAGQQFDLGGRTLEVIHTPGHTMGSVCVLDKERRWLFTGDTCCKGNVLLQLKYCGTVADFAGTVAKLQARRGEFDTLWPAHHEIPASPALLDQFAEAADAILSGKATGEAFTGRFGQALRLHWGDIAIDYSPNRIR